METDKLHDISLGKGLRRLSQICRYNVWRQLHLFICHIVIDLVLLLRIFLPISKIADKLSEKQYGKLKNLSPQ